MVLIHGGGLGWLSLGDDGSCEEPAAQWLRAAAPQSVADALVFDCPPEGAAAPEQSASAQLLRSEGKPTGQIWVLFCVESSVRFPLLKLPAYLALFDVVVSVSPQTADVTFSYMPRQLSLFQTPPPMLQAGSGARGGSTLATAAGDAGLLGGLAVWIASNCAEPRLGRVQSLAQALRRLAGRDADATRLLASHGACLRNRPWPSDEALGHPVHGSRKMALLRRYKFTLAYENSRAKGYVTEKFFQPLVAGSVPVYWGAPDVAQFAPHTHSYIDASTFRDADALAQHLLYLDRNDTAYQEYLAWKQDAAAGNWRQEFRAAAATSGVVGDVYGEAAHHCGTACQWRYDPCRVNAAIRARLSAARASAPAPPTPSGLIERLPDEVISESEEDVCDEVSGTGVAPSLRLSDGVLADGQATWWLPVRFGSNTTHLLRLSASMPADGRAVGACALYA
eukprot:SAG25_NODE_761_length_5514_cov_23.676822_3_plen_451_part_00